MRLAAAALLFLVAASCSQPREPLGTFNTIPAFELIDQNGAAFSSAAQLSGKVWIADFIFTNCQGPCPRMGSQMRTVQKELASVPDIRLVSFTVDPKRDTPEALGAYAKRFGAEPGRWFFLTGPPETLGWLSLEAFMLSKVNERLDHSTRFVLIDRRGVVRKYYETTEPTNIAALVADARALARAGS